MLDTFTEIKETKKILDKLKKVCSAMSKFNLNSPCLLQFIRINGEYEVILSYDPKNGDTFNYYDIFNTITLDNYIISEEDEKFFIKPDERVSIPVIVSSYPIADNNKITNVNPIKYYHDLAYNYSLDSYYVFPKFVLEAIKAEYITGFEVMDNSNGTFNFNIKMGDSPRFNYTLFIHNEDRLERIFRLSILPLHLQSSIRDLYMKLFLNSATSKLVIDPEKWKEDYEKYKDWNAFKLEGMNDHPFTIYHNDFFQSKITYGRAAKYYETDDGSSNIASLYFAIDLTNVHEYFKYRYFDI